MADGCFSKLRKSLVHDIPEQKSTFVGLLLNDCPQSNPKFAELILTDTSPILVYRISEHLTRLFVDIRGQKVPRDLRKYLEDTIYHQLPGFQVEKNFTSYIKLFIIIFYCRPFARSFLRCGEEWTN